jgi:hypothetical protein
MYKLNYKKENSNEAIKLSYTDNKSITDSYKNKKLVKITSIDSGAEDYVDIKFWDRRANKYRKIRMSLCDLGDVFLATKAWVKLNNKLLERHSFKVIKKEVK